MISKLIIDNFKAIEHLELELRPFQVFVGPNDSGKSTILQALDLLGRSTILGIKGAPCLFEEPFERYLPHGEVARTMKLEVRGTCAGGDYSYRIEWAARPAPRVAFEELTVAGELKFHRDQPADSSWSLLSQGEDEHPEVHAELRSFVTRFDPQKLAAPASLGSQLESDGTGLASLVDDLLTASDRAHRSRGRHRDARPPLPRDRRAARDLRRREGEPATEGSHPGRRGPPRAPGRRRSAPPPLRRPHLCARRRRPSRRPPPPARRGLREPRCAARRRDRRRDARGVG